MFIDVSSWPDSFKILCLGFQIRSMAIIQVGASKVKGRNSSGYGFDRELEEAQVGLM